jgi:hypothetical protein
MQDETSVPLGLVQSKNDVVQLGTVVRQCHVIGHDKNLMICQYRAMA